MACEDDRARLSVSLTDCAERAARTFTGLGNIQAVAIGFKSVFCDVTSRRYNPNCCTLYGNMLDAVPTDLQDRWDRAVQFATDALGLIDCSQADWPERVAEAEARVNDCWSVLAAIVAAMTALQAAIDDAQAQGCS